MAWQLKCSLTGEKIKKINKKIKPVGTGIRVEGDETTKKKKKGNAKVSKLAQSSLHRSSKAQPCS